MGLVISVHGSVAAVDGTPQVGTSRSVTTLNPVPGDVAVEAEVARAKIKTLVAEMEQELLEQLEDWERALRVQHKQ